MSSRSRRGPTTLTYRSPLDSYGDEYYAYLRNLLTRINRGYDARRDSERRYEEDSNSSVVRMLILFSLHPVLLIHPVLLVHSNEEHENEVLDRDLATPPPSEVLKVAAVEFYVKQNAQRHHTDDFELVLEDTPTPILRRGQEFYMAIKFANKEYNSRRDILRLAFGFGPYPSVPKGTKVILPVRGNETFSEDENKDTWDVRLNSQPSGRIVTLVVKIPSSVPVGVWKCTIECGMFARQTVAGGRVEIPRRNNSSTPWKETFSRFECKEDIYILFNPWIKDDPVYMDNDIWRKESVLNDTGKIWIGNYKKMSGRQWVYGQFDDAVLPATMMLLELSNLNFNERGNPIKVARAISAVVNSNDDEGLVVGRWDGKYDDGTAPYMWTGSVKILEEFLKTGKPVKYGQCWVFAGVTTTICRALGIPCRAVTNFVSAHDTDGTLTVDKYFDLEGEPVEGGPSGETFDSIWNFHVWNDVWISRSDLPQGYGGWQAIDATPQERSGGMFRCGPASLAAVKRGEVGFSHDVSFVFSELNADILHWQEDPESDWGYTLMKTNKYHVGRFVVTKHPSRDDPYGDSDSHDITHEYKQEEGSTAERLTMLNAARCCDNARRYFNLPKDIVEDVELDLVDVEKLEIGEPFKVTVIATNRSSATRTIKILMSSSSIYYNGSRGKHILKTSGKFAVRSGHRETVSMKVDPREYLDKLVDYGMIKIYALATVEETKQTWSEEDDFQIEKPRLQIKFREPAVVDKNLLVTFSFTNPLDVALTKCKFSFEGPGLKRPIITRHRDVPPRGSVSHVERFIPRRAGQKRFVATFSSVELIDVRGSATVTVHTSSL